MAQAVLRLYPETKVTIGPVVENGFYYDFDRDTPFTVSSLYICSCMSCYLKKYRRERD